MKDYCPEYSRHILTVIHQETIRNLAALELVYQRLERGTGRPDLYNAIRAFEQARDSISEAIAASYQKVTP